MLLTRTSYLHNQLHTCTCRAHRHYNVSYTTMRTCICAYSFGFMCRCCTLNAHERIGSHTTRTQLAHARTHAPHSSISSAVPTTCMHQHMSISSHNSLFARAERLHINNFHPGACLRFLIDRRYCQRAALHINNFHPGACAFSWSAGISIEPLCHPLQSRTAYVYICTICALPYIYVTRLTTSISPSFRHGILHSAHYTLSMFIPALYEKAQAAHHAPLCCLLT